MDFFWSGLYSAVFQEYGNITIILIDLDNEDVLGPVQKQSFPMKFLKFYPHHKIFLLPAFEEFSDVLAPEFNLEHSIWDKIKQMF